MMKPQRLPELEWNPEGSRRADERLPGNEGDYHVLLELGHLEDGSQLHVQDALGERDLTAATAADGGGGLWRLVATADQLEEVVDPMQAA